VFVNAHSGEIAFHYSLIHYALHRHIYENGELVRHEGDDPVDIPDVNNVYDYLGFAYDFYYTQHGRDSINGSGMDLNASVRELGCESSWLGATIYCGAGFASDDVVGHEYTHGVTGYESNLANSGESGAISESFSDMWGEWVDQTNGDGNDAPEIKWKVGEDTPRGVYRDMNNPPECSTLYGGPMPDRRNSPYWYGGLEDNRGIHHNSGVGNKLCYLLTDGDMFRGYIVTGMGIEKTADLFYECQTHLLTSDADYYDLGNVLTQAAINIGLTWIECENV